MSREKSGRETWRGWLCKLVGHAPEVVDEEIVDGGDYVDVSIRCQRCGTESEEHLEYNEVTQP